MYYISEALFQSLLKDDKLRVLDCGASAGGEQGRWAFLGPRLELHGFEPDTEECERLNAMAKAVGLDCRTYPLYLGRTETGRTLYIKPERFNVSLFEWNMPFYERLKLVDGTVIRRASDALIPGRTSKVDTISLDDWGDIYGVRDVDFIKNDVDGPELELMQAAPRMMAQAAGVQIDVVFNDCWVKTPKFADIDAWMHRNEFFLMDLRRLKRNGRYDSPYTAPGGSLTRPGQVMCGEALYFRDPIVSAIPFTKALKLACIAEVMNHLEFAFEILAFLARHERDPATRSGLSNLVDAAAAYYSRRDSRWMRILVELRSKVAKTLPRPIVALLRPVDRLLPFR
jgi:FkbM family methyltransferase